MRLRAADVAWTNFWFKPGDPFLLGLLRVLTGLMLTYNLAVWSFDLEAFFSHDGLQPIDAIRELHSRRWIFSFWLWIDDAWMWPVHGASVGIAVLFTAGLLTRVTSVLAFLVTISYSQRVPVANFGLDQILGILCLYLAIGPSGAALSIDAWLRERRLRRAGLPSDDRRLRASATVATRLIQLHWCAIYFWAGHAKLKGETWWTGEAMWNVLANQEYQTWDLTWLAHWPWMPYLVAHVTILWESFFPVLVWNRRLRPWFLWPGLAMHLGIGAFLGMWTFGLSMAFAYLAFLDAAWWRHATERWFARRRATGSRTPVTSPSAIDVDGTANASNRLAASPLATSPQTAERCNVPVLIVARVESDRQSIAMYLSQHGYAVAITDNISTLRREIDRSRVTLVLVHSARFLPTELAAAADELGRLSTVSGLLLLTERLRPYGAAIDLPSNVRWLALPVSLNQVRHELQKLSSDREHSQSIRDAAAPVQGRATNVPGAAAASAG